VTDADLDTRLTEYAAALEEEAALLTELRDRSIEQREAVTQGAAPSTLNTLLAERERILASLLGIDERVRPLRAWTSANQPALRHHPAYTRAASALEVVADLVAGIQSADAETVAILRREQESRGHLAQALHAGDDALSAYRRALSSPTPTASVIRQRG
jgi:hypothetical protein